jgi:hypothetical protein
MNPVARIPPRWFKIHCIVILPSTTCSFKCSRPFKFCVSHLSHVTDANMSFFFSRIRTVTSGTVGSLVSYNACYTPSLFWQKLLLLQEPARHCSRSFHPVTKLFCTRLVLQMQSAIIYSLEVASSQWSNVERNQIYSNQFNVNVGNLR